MTDNELHLRMIIHQALYDIEKSLNAKVTSMEKIKTVYGFNTTSFHIKVSLANGNTTSYFLKFGNTERIRQELAGISFVEKFIPTPKVVLTSKEESFRFGWTLSEYISGKLMAENFLEIENRNDLKLFCELEKEKELLLRNLHDKIKTILSYKSYIGSRVNQLFYGRLFGERYQLFFARDHNNLSSYFNHRLIVNGKKFQFTIGETLKMIQEKYTPQADREVMAIMGHGDAHHGNIILNSKIWFIDNEYADFMPPFMELAKPYYNDFIGRLFFHHPKILNQYFQIDHFEEKNNQLVFKISYPQKMINSLAITQVKLQMRNKFVNNKTDDFLSLNDYLVLCHTLTRDPNAYPTESRLLFLVFIVILAQFDPFDPESIYKFF